MRIFISNKYLCDICQRWWWNWYKKYGRKHSTILCLMMFNPREHFYIAQLCWEKVYHPFIRHNIQIKYGWDDNNVNLPDHLQAVSWMDGANVQLKRSISYEHLNYKEKMEAACTFRLTYCSKTRSWLWSNVQVDEMSFQGNGHSTCRVWYLIKFFGTLYWFS